MPASKSFIIVILLTLLTAIAPIGVQMYLPSLPGIARDFGSGVAEIQLTVSGFMGGFAFAHLFYGPISDRLGRRVTLIGGTVLYLIASLIAMVAPNAGLLIAARVVQGLGAGAAEIPIVIADSGDSASLQAMVERTRVRNTVQGAAFVRAGPHSWM